MSHPTWVRGLKLSTCDNWKSRGVAPYVGAWIETDLDINVTISGGSHPTWVRGLKH